MDIVEINDITEYAKNKFSRSKCELLSSKECNVKELELNIN